MLCSTSALRGKKATCFFAIKDDVVNAGATYLDAEVVRDGNLITSRKPDDLPAFVVELMKAIQERNRLLERVNAMSSPWSGLTFLTPCTTSSSARVLFSETNSSGPRCRCPINGLIFLLLFDDFRRHVFGSPMIRRERNLMPFGMLLKLSYEMVVITVVLITAPPCLPFAD